MDEYLERLNKQYHVLVISGGCIGGGPIQCYNQIMSNEIKERFGQDVFTKVWKSIK